MPDPLDALQPSSRFLQAVVPMAVLDLDGRLRLVNDAFARLLGRAASSLQGTQVEQLIVEPDRAAAADAFARARAGQPVGEVEQRLATPGGEADVQVAWSLLRDESGEPSYLTAVLVDVSAQRRREAAVRRSESRYRARFAQSSVPQVMTDETGRILEANPAFCELLGITPEHWRGQDVRAVGAADDDSDALLGEVLAGERPSARYERVLRDAAGRTVPVLVDVTGLRDEQGRVDGAAAFVQDLRTLRELERRRDQQEQFFLALSQRASDLALVGDADGVIVYASPAVRHVLGYEVEDVLQIEGWDFIHPDDAERVTRDYQAVVADGTTRTFAFRVKLPDGRWRWVEETATNLLDSPVGGVVCNLRDVHEQVEAVQALEASEARFRGIAETADEGIALVAPDGTTLFANARLAEMLGRPLPELYGRPGTTLFPLEVSAELHSRVAERLARGADRYELVYGHPDGTDRLLAVAASPLPGEDGEHVGSVVMVGDVTDARRAEEQLRRAALHDALTGLPNRAVLHDRLDRVLARQQATGDPAGAAVLLLDLDDFRLVNDSRGHGVGDSLLVAVAQRLRDTARPVDTVARLGADAFVVVCEGTDSEQALVLARQLLTALDAPFEVEGQRLHVTAAVGVAHTPAASSDDLLRFADTALHAAKGEGPGGVVLFDRVHAEQAERRLALAVDLRAAIEADAVRLDYQPLVDLDSGRVGGVEALARWQHPEHGPVPPARFVEVAEQSGLVVQLDCWALERAVRETADLRARGLLAPHVTVAVNLSVRTVAAPVIEELVDRVLTDTGTPAHLLVLEITESAVMQDAERAVQVLSRLRAKGVGIAVDDFGTGYSSLAYLRDLPLTSLKIDRSFVATIVDDRDALAIVASIVDLGRAVGVTVVAEGVETAEQAALLGRLGCRQAQGWLWSPALSPDQVEQVAGTWRAGFAVRPARAARTTPKPAERWEVLPEHGADRLLELHGQGASLTTIAAALNGEGFRTPTGARWHRTTVARTVAEAAYPDLRAAVSRS